MAATGRKVPLWAWQLNAWIDNGRKGPRPAGAPKHAPVWFWTWRHLHLPHAKRKGAKAWKNYRNVQPPRPPKARKPTLHKDRAKAVRHA